MFNTSEVDKWDSDLTWLVSELDAFQGELYPAESNQCLDFSTVSDKQLRCVIVRNEGVPESLRSRFSFLMVPVAPFFTLSEMLIPLLTAFRPACATVSLLNDGGLAKRYPTDTTLRVLTLRQRA